MKPADMIGQRFGRLTVMEDSGQRRGNCVLWRCRCDCGGEILAARYQLVNGAVRDCGCMPRPARPRVTDLIGRRFGMLTVEGDSGQRGGGSSVILWRCRCDCGGEILATRQQLLSGNVANCGCVPRQRASTRQAEDLTGRQFGELTALRRAENDGQGRVRWLCRCSCGREITVPALRLKNGHTRSCGCRRYGGACRKRDLTDQRFGRLTVLQRNDEKSTARKTIWHCRCDCGNEVDVISGNLLQGLTLSCGCRNREKNTKMHEHMHYQDRTCVEILRRSCAETGRNKEGFRGLYRLKNGKYRASITFQGKHYDLGHYESYDQAVQARLEAEETLHMGYLRAYEEYEKRARSDPAWAEDNPFFYQASRTDGRFQIATNGRT